MSSTREKLWVVRAQDGTSLVAILKRAGEDERALDEGRVFVGKRRVSGEQVVKVGDAIRIGARGGGRGGAGAGSGAGAAGALPAIEVLFDREGVVACIKPAGLPTVPDHAGAAHSLVALVEKQTGRRGLRVTSRLDREVSGVVMFATDDASEARLRAARTAGTYARRYIALAYDAGTPDVSDADAGAGAAGFWDAPIGRAKNPLLRAVNGPDAKDARTQWRIAGARELAASANAGTDARGARADAAARVLLLAVEPETGRTHQIRVHSAHAGWPLLGDRDYGGPAKLTLANGAVVAPARIALHAARVSVAGLTAEAPIPAELQALWRSLGGDASAWEAALAP